jgi:hypothetical protein
VCDDQACCDTIARDVNALRTSASAAASDGHRRLTIIVLHPLSGEFASAAIRPAVEIAVRSHSFAWYICSGTEPHLLQDRPTSAPGPARICSGTGSHLRRDYTWLR